MFFGTLMGLIAAAVFALSYNNEVPPFDIYGLQLVVTVSGALFLFLAFLAKALSWSALQKTEQESNPRAEELFLKDRLLPCLLVAILGLSLFSFLLAILSSPSIALNISLIIILWLVSCGISFDLLTTYMRRLLRYSQHEFLLGRVRQECLKAAKNGNDGEAFAWLDSVVEVTIKAIKTGSAHLASQTLFQMITLIDGFIRFAGKAYTLAPPESTEVTLYDKVRYLASHICKKFEWVFQNALKEEMNPVAEDVINAFGKISLLLMKYHPSLANIPLGYIEECSNKALKVGNEEISIRAAVTLSELIKNYIILSRDKGESFKGLIFTALSSLEEMTKRNFQQNKEVNPALLMQPFAEIGQMIGQSAFQIFPDREEILRELKRILLQFNALDLVMAKVQPGATIVEPVPQL